MKIVEVKIKKIHYC